MAFLQSFLRVRPWLVIWFIFASSLASVPVQAAATLTGTSRFSYSTTGGEVGGRRILLGPDPDSLQGYTHYLVPSVDALRSANFSAYNFTIQLAGGTSGNTQTQRNDTGFFITMWELTDLEEKVTAQTTHTGEKEPVRTHRNRVCINFQITLSYPLEASKPSVQLCNWKGELTGSILDLLTFGDYTGYNGTGSGGSVQVRIERTIRSMPRITKLIFAGHGLNTKEIDPWKRVGARGRGAAASIPAESIGGLTFTFYQDCEIASVLSASKGKSLRFRPCSSLHTFTCISSELFCDSEPNCEKPIWEILYAEHTRRKAANLTKATTEEEEGYDDESRAACGTVAGSRGPSGVGRLGWERTTTTTHTYTNTQGQAQSGVSHDGAEVEGMRGELESE